MVELPSVAGTWKQGGAQGHRRQGAPLANDRVAAGDDVAADMTYEEALVFLYSFTDYERHPPHSPETRPFRLGPFRRLLRRVGNPHERFHTVHVAGTKGKGSVAAMLERIARAAGYRTGLYTSPHLEDVRERIRVNGADIPRESFASGLTTLKTALDPQTARGYRTTFELLTALAFQHFAQRGVELAVIEAGLGGLLDSTNVVRPTVAVITPVAVEHAALLGCRLADVALQKAGIVKRGSRVVTARQKPVVREVITTRCALVDAPLVETGRQIRSRRLQSGPEGQRFSVATSNRMYRNLRIPLHGRHQIANACLAIGAAEALDVQGVAIREQDIRKGLAEVCWPGRIEFLSGAPALLLDGAHTPGSMTTLDEFLRETTWLPPPPSRVIVFGASRDKRLGTMLARARSWGRWLILTRSNHPKAASYRLLLETGVVKGGVHIAVCEPAAAALMLARRLAGRQGLVVVTGSLYLVGDLRAEARKTLS